MGNIISLKIKWIDALLSRYRSHVILAIEYLGAFAATRLLAAASGLLLVRILSVADYGFYTVVLSAFVFVCSFSDLGITEALSFFRRRAIKRRRDWLQYLVAVISLRRRFFFAGFLIASIYVYFTVSRLSESPLEIILGTLLMGLAAWFAVRNSVAIYNLRLEQQFRKAYAVEISVEFAKLFGICGLWLCGLGTALGGITTILFGAVAATLTLIIINGSVKRRSGVYSKIRIHRARRIVLYQVLPVLPGTIYFIAAHGLFTVWLAGYYGSLENVAEVGALGRLGALISVMMGFSSNVFIPRLVAQTDDEVFFKKFLQWTVVIALYSVTVVVVIAQSPRLVLSILGSGYENLNQELLITAYISVVVTFSTFFWNVNRSRGWVSYQPYRVLLMIAGQLPMVIFMDFSTTRNVLIFSLITYLIDMIFQGITVSRGLLSNRRGRWWGFR